MSKRKNGSYYDNHQRATELHDGPGHTHRVGEEQGKQEHLTGHEQSRQSAEHLHGAHPQAQGATTGHGIPAFGHAEIAALANELWHARGCPEGSPEEDWFEAARQLRSRALSSVSGTAS